MIAGLGSTVNSTPRVNVPATPTNLTATPGDGQVAVTWDNPGNITIRKYQYSTDGGTTFNHMNGSGRNTTSFTFSNLTDGTEYELAIRASNRSGESEAATVTATPGPPVPAAPTNLTATPGNGQVTLTWDDPGDSTITKYQYKASGDQTFTDIPNSNQNTTSFTFTGLVNGEPYWLAIRASNRSGNGEAATLTATPGWPAPTNLVAGVDSTRIVLQWDTGVPGSPIT